MKKNIRAKSKFGNIRVINIMMYVAIIFFVSPYLLKDIILFSHKILTSQEK